ncbi:MAG: hypothetical protein HDT42_06830 [Ruminococcaceae bacterium]|nr:hypothetical protein [Oscillospiraceae bacterium]
MPSEIKATIVMAAIGILIILIGVLLMFFTLANLGWVRLLRPSSRIKHGILSAFVLIVGILFVLFNFLPD